MAMKTIIGDIKYDTETLNTNRTYEGYENSFIITNYMESLDGPADVYFTSTDYSEIEEKMNDDDLWEDYNISWVDDGSRGYSGIYY